MSSLEDTRPLPVTEASERPGRPASLDEDRRAALLTSVSSGRRSDASTPDQAHAFERGVFARAFEILGGRDALGRTIASNGDLIQAILGGWPALTLRRLTSVGYPHIVLEQVIAPRRTLVRLRGEGRRLTRAQSDAAWRLAYALALAGHVVPGRKAALAWLIQPRSAFFGESAIDLLETSIGTAVVEVMIRSIYRGDAD